MKRLNRITEIIKVEPFKITCRWTTGEVKVIDFEILLKQWNIKSADFEYQLLDYQNFKFVSVSEQRTLHWVNLPYNHTYWNEDGDSITTSSPFTLDPDILYEASLPLENFRLVMLAA